MDSIAYTQRCSTNLLRELELRLAWRCALSKSPCAINAAYCPPSGELLHLQHACALHNQLQMYFYWFLLLQTR